MSNISHRDQSEHGRAFHVRSPSDFNFQHTRFNLPSRDCKIGCVDCEAFLYHMYLQWDKFIDFSKLSAWKNMQERLEESKS